MAHELTAYAAHIRELRKQFSSCCTSPYKQMGIRRLSDAEDFLGRNPDYSYALIEHAKSYLTYAQEYDLIQRYRREINAQIGLCGEVGEVGGQDDQSPVGRQIDW